MPAAVWVPAAATLAGSLFGAAAGARSNSRATDANSRAQAEALAFAKEQEAQRRREYEERLAMEKQQWEAREARKAEILARYGRSYTPRPYAQGAPNPTPAPPRAPGATNAPTLGARRFEPETPSLMAPRTPWGY